ncbi:MAG: hypothetical protein K0Q84_749 [Arthrobacter sp.]|nr:hypothetical protein [Arthrobacter sp.]
MSVPAVRVAVSDAQRNHERRVQFRQTGAQMHPATLQEPRGKAEPDGGVMVPAGEHHPGAGPGQPDKCLVQEAHDVHSGQGTVIHVAGDEDDVDGQFLDPRYQLVDESALGVQHANAVKGPAKMPIGSVE